MSDLELPDFVFETAKNRVVIYPNRVVKTFKPTRRSARHARREATALRRLQGLPGVPTLLEVSTDGHTLVMTRVPGVPLGDGGTLTEQNLVDLRALVAQMLRRGVARHSLPKRDILLGDDGSIGLVDFERSTRRMFAADPIWPVACVVTRFNILRLVNGHAPHLLTAEEHAWLRRQVRLRAALQHPLRFKRWLFRLVGLTPARKPSASVPDKPV
jgi:hypothetical protein